MAEFRWILAALGVVLIGGIWWWGSRRSGHAPGRPDFRETPPLTSEVDARAFAPRPQAEPRERSVPQLEPLNIRTATAAEEPLFDEPMTALAEPVDMSVDQEHAATDIGDHTRTSADHAATAVSTATRPYIAPAAAPVQAAPPAPAPGNPPSRVRAPAHAPGDGPDRHSSTAAPAPNTSELQRIVTIRVCAPGDGRWPGQRLMEALELLGLAFGRYNVYHRKHVDGRSLFCVASLVEPGTFNPARMPAEEFRGVTLFAVLPGPMDPVQTLDALFETAGGLAEELSGVVQDHKGIVMTASGAVALREEMVQFQALLTS